jgi:hypothetical protein
MASLVTIAIATALAFGVMFGAFFAVSFAIRREDASGTLTGRAPNRTCRSARHVAGYHRVDQVAPRTPRIAI